MGLLFKGSASDLANFRGYGQVEAERCFLDIDLFRARVLDDKVCFLFAVWFGEDFV